MMDRDDMAHADAEMDRWAGTPDMLLRVAVRCRAHPAGVTGTSQVLRVGVSRDINHADGRI